MAFAADQVRTIKEAMMLRKPVLAIGAAASVFALVAAGASTFSVSNASGTPDKISPVMSGNVSYTIDAACTDSFTVDWDSNTDQTKISKLTVTDVTTNPTCTGEFTLAGGMFVYHYQDELSVLYTESDTSALQQGDWLRIDSVADEWDGRYQVISQEGGNITFQSYARNTWMDNAVTSAVAEIGASYQLAIDTYSVDGSNKTKIDALSRAAAPLEGATVVIDPAADVDITAYKSLMVVVSVQHL